MTKLGKRKIGRNELCPCGSGEKLKRCHGRPTAKPLGPPPEVLEAMQKAHEAQEKLRQHQQGLGRPIIGADFKGFRLTAVGNRILWSKDHKTFIDVLSDYIRWTLGEDWGNAEIKKPLDERHQVLKWYDALCAYQNKHREKPAGEIETAPATGLIRSYYGLAYNLYLLEHNVELRDYLVKRLKTKDQFFGAYYETCVAAWFILAGFQLTLENEEDARRKHVEFVATKDGKSYTVEAKFRQPGKENLDVGNQLHKALKKPANHPRIVFIEMNIPDVQNQDAYSEEIIATIHDREESATFRPNGEEAPPAYVIVTNQPYHLLLNEEQILYSWLAVGFKTPDFGHNVMFPSLVEGFKSRQRHSGLLDLQKAFTNYSIPVTMDGEIPEFAFGEAERRFIIGERHRMDDGRVGTLTSGIVIESEQAATLVYSMEDGTSAIYKGPLSDAELRAYRAHPETFFGQVQNVGKNITEPIEMFAWMYASYKDTPRQKILEWMAQAPDIDELSKLSDEDLRLIYIERCVYSMMQKKAGREEEQKE